MSHRVFISYRRLDSGHISQSLFKRFAGAFGDDQVFRDLDSIPAGTEFEQIIRDDISTSDVMLVVIGPKWLRRPESGEIAAPDFVMVEIELALRTGVPLIVCLVDGVSMPESHDIPEALRPLLDAPRAELDPAQPAAGWRELAAMIAALPIRHHARVSRQRYSLVARQILTRSWHGAVVAAGVWLISYPAMLSDSRWAGGVVLIGAMGLPSVVGAVAGKKLAGWLGAAAGFIVLPVLTVLIAIGIAVPYSIPIQLWERTIESWFPRSRYAAVPLLFVLPIVGTWLVAVWRLRVHARHRATRRRMRYGILQVIFAAIAGGCAAWGLGLAVGLCVERITPEYAYNILVAALGYSGVTALGVIAGGIAGFGEGWARAWRRVRT